MVQHGNPARELIRTNMPQIKIPLSRAVTYGHPNFKTIQSPGHPPFFFVLGDRSGNSQPRMRAGFVFLDFRFLELAQSQKIKT